METRGQTGLLMPNTSRDNTLQLVQRMLGGTEDSDQGLSGDGLPHHALRLRHLPGRAVWSAEAARDTLHLLRKTGYPIQ